ncbi:MAG: class I SAM-dependent RNA methyltransferase [Verrucomicrobiia bacterium]|jgi:tRNA/tmRNA/rRNA uracil-C5-methylase (TrmA/RlmC/RlmD family)
MEFEKKITEPQLKIGSRIEVEIQDIAFGGEGVGRYSDFVVFVPFTIPGEKVVAEITEIKKNFARARAVKLLEQSPERVVPVCKYFGECGGCQYQHIAYPYQLKIKQKQIIDLLERIGGFVAPVVDAVAACPREYGYRNKILVRSQWNKIEQRLVIGFLKYDNRLVADIDECKIAEPDINEQLRILRQNPPPRGGLKVTLRIFPEEWEVPRDSFFQNNFYALPILVEKVANFVKQSRARYLIDAYCGIGFFGIELSSQVEKVIGVDLDELAIKAARKNAQRRGAKNCHFYAGKFETLLPEILKAIDPKETVLIMDPPRTGVACDGLKFLRQNAPQQVIYVSCHPATFARDLKILCEGGAFELRRVSPVDMFPQTQHIECVANLQRK